MPAAVEVLRSGLGFDEAIRYFRRKVDLPSRTWRDLWQGMHARAFVVAGAMKEELLSDMRAAVDKAIAEGTTLAEFRRDFDKIVARHGWSYRGSRGWRTSVIFNTNVQTAYQAGHYKQMSDPDVARLRPWWRYVAVLDSRTRPLHRAWHNTVLRHDDPWWRTHFPPNGWGCRCSVVSMSAREVERLRAQGEDLKETAPELGTEEWVDPDTGEIREVPRGIDPGWDYNVGEAAWGRHLSRKAMDAWRSQGAAAWEPLTFGSWEAYGRPERIPADPPRAQMGKRLATVEEIRRALREILGGEEKVFFVPPAPPHAGPTAGFRLPVLVNAESLERHVDPNRSAFLPFLSEALEEPFEVWLRFERHRGTGRVELRARVIKAIRLGKDHGILLVAQGKGGFLEAWTVVPTSDLAYLNRQRAGWLYWAR